MRICIDIKDCVKRGAKDMPAATVTLSDGKSYDVKFTSQKTGFGEKLFFMCPRCGSRRTKLYVCGDELLCSDCYPLPVYRGIKNVTPGGYDYIQYRMHRLANNEEIRIKRMPFCYLEYLKPKYKHYDKWEWALKRLQALENMRNQAIFFQKVWKKEVVRSVLEGTNTFLYACNLYELDKYFYDFEQGYQDFRNRYSVEMIEAIKAK